MESSYIMRVLVSIDQLGNAIAGGNPDVTISARTGYFANIKKTPLRYWWLTMELIINFAFYPVDGPDHCLRAYESDSDELHHEGNDIVRALLGIIIVAACTIIAGVTHLWVFIDPSSRFDAA